MAARLTLANLVILAIPINNMQVEKIPSAIYKAIERMQRDFI